MAEAYLHLIYILCKLESNHQYENVSIVLTDRESMRLDTNIVLIWNP